MRARPWGQHVRVHRRLRPLRLLAAALVLGAAACGSGTHETATAQREVGSAKGSPSSALATTPPSAGKRGAAVVGARRSRSAAPVRTPRFRRRVDPGQTGWFASPSLVDLNGDGKLEIVAPMYSTYVFSGSGRRLATGTASAGRVYAPSVVADLDRDGTKDIVVGGTGSVVAYEWRGSRLVVTPGWPASVGSWATSAAGHVDLCSSGRRSAGRSRKISKIGRGRSHPAVPLALLSCPLLD